MTFQTGNEILNFLMQQAEKRGGNNGVRQSEMIGVSQATLCRARNGTNQKTKTGKHQGLSENIIRDACEKMGFKLRLVVEDA